MKRWLTATSLLLMLLISFFSITLPIMPTSGNPDPGSSTLHVVQYGFRIGATGQWQWTTADAHSGSLSLNLSTGSSSSGRAVIALKCNLVTSTFPSPGNLSDLYYAVLTYWAKNLTWTTPNFYPWVQIYLDMDDDGVFDWSASESDWILQGEPYYWLQYNTPPVENGWKQFNASTLYFFDGNYTYSYVESAHDKRTLDWYLANTPLGDEDILRLYIMVGYGGSWVNTIGLVDDIALGGVIYHGSIQDAIDAASPGETILVHDGTYNEALYINKSLTIKAASTPVIKGSKSFTTNYGAREAVIFVENALNVVLEGLDIEGEGLGPGKNYGVIYENSSGVIRDCIVSPNTVGDMVGNAIGAWDGSDLTVDPCTIKNFGRIGVFYFGGGGGGCSGGVYNSTIIGQVYTDVNYVCYGIEIEAYYYACDIEIIGNNIFNCSNTNVPPTWDSAGIYIDGWLEYMSTPSSTVVIEENNIHDNYIGIWVVANALSHAHYNNIYNNTAYGVYSASDYLSNYVTFDARFNWWGKASGPTHSSNTGGTGDKISDYVDYSPWLGATFATTPRTYHVNLSGAPGAIQEAINEASPGDTVIVHDGTYDEQVVISKRLTLQGTGSTPIIQPSGPSVLTSLYTLGTQAGAFWNGHKLASIISVQNVGAPGVKVKNLIVDGVNVNALPAGANYVVGISYGETNGTIDNVTVRNMNSVPVATRTYGMWLDAVSIPTPVSVEVNNSRINYYNKNGIIARGAKQIAKIHNNTIIGPGDGGAQVPNGIVFAFEAGGTARYNNISALHYTLGTWLGFGIMGYQAKDGLIIEYNVVHDSDVGIGPSSNGTIRGNEIYDCYQGIELEWQTECAYNNITCNTIHDNYYGIHLLGPGSPYYTGPGDEPGPGNTANYNNIYNNTEGVRNWDATQIFDARYNWWGDASGPTHPSNPGGSGDAVSDNVNFIPWLLATKIPAEIHDVAVLPPIPIPYTPPIIRVQAGTTLQIEVTARNLGTRFENFSVTVYYDDNPIGTQLVNELHPLTDKLLTFYWNTTGVTPHIDYHLRSEASRVQNETNIANNKDYQLYPVLVGYFHNSTLKVEPHTVPSKVLFANETFNVNITINNLSEDWRATGVQFSLRYNKSLIELVEPVTEGPFFTQFAVSPGQVTLCAYALMDDCVKAMVWLSPNENGTYPIWPKGSGTVVTITFKVVYTVPKGTIASSDLTLFDPLLIDEEVEPLPINLESGICEILGTHIADINYDKKVDMKDIGTAAIAFGSYPGHPRWNPICDLNGDAKVDMKDIGFIARNFGWKPPDC